jgi:hypothetical protein
MIQVGKRSSGARVAVTLRIDWGIQLSESGAENIDTSVLG